MTGRSATPPGSLFGAQGFEPSPPPPPESKPPRLVSAQPPPPLPPELRPPLSDVRRRIPSTSELNPSGSADFTQPGGPESSALSPQAARGPANYDTRQAT